MTPPLQGRIAVVTGATRGVGRGIALALGAAGAAVYLTGRSAGGDRTEGLPGTVDETAGRITAAGGRAVAVRCDHTNDAAVEALFARVRQEAGRLDVLVNNVWGGYEQHEGARFVAPFWEQPLRLWDGMFTAGVRAALVASKEAVPLLQTAGGGLIVHVTAWDRDKYLGNVYYDTAKAAINRLAFGMARELLPHRVAVVALAPGFVRTERVELAFTAAGRPLPDTLESPSYAGRAVAALAADPGVLRHAGRTVTAGELARLYGFTDLDGRQPPPFHLPD